MYQIYGYGDFLKLAVVAIYTHLYVNVFFMKIRLHILIVVLYKGGLGQYQTMVTL